MNVLDLRPRQKYRGFSPDAVRSTPACSLLGSDRVSEHSSLTGKAGICARLSISVVTETELRFGVSLQYDTHTEAHETAIEALQRLLARFDVEPVSRPVARVAGDIMGNLQSRGAELNDLHAVYIAATAIVESVPVLTANVDHFDRIEDVSVIDWSSY